MTDHIGLLLKKKRADRFTIIKALQAAPPKRGRRTWAKWLKQNATECAALEQAQSALAGLQAVKRAAKNS